MPAPSEVQSVVIVTDAWTPQVNGVVRTLQNTQRELNALGVRVEFITPGAFRTLPCPSYPEIRLSVTTGERVGKIIEKLQPDALHIATEGPLGWAARGAAKRRRWQFTTAYHSRFPEYVNARTGIPAAWLYPIFRRFHGAAAATLVPTQAIIDDLEARAFRNVVHWSRGVDHAIFHPRAGQSAVNPAAPVFLYAGRLAVQKNVEAFLKLDLPGEKWIAGEGPLETALRKKYPDHRWIGVVSQNELAELYSAADVFVFPSLTDTFGLVMVEAMSCGLPVAAFPAAGPVDVVGASGAGVLSNDLREACLQCLSIPRQRAVAHARTFTWQRATRQFYDALVPLSGRKSTTSRDPALHARPA